MSTTSQKVCPNGLQWNVKHWGVTICAVCAGLPLIRSQIAMRKRFYAESGSAVRKGVWTVLGKIVGAGDEASGRYR